MKGGLAVLARDRLQVPQQLANRFGRGDLFWMREFHFFGNFEKISVQKPIVRRRAGGTAACRPAASLVMRPRAA